MEVQSREEVPSAFDHSGSERLLDMNDIHEAGIFDQYGFGTKSYSRASESRTNCASEGIGTLAGTRVYAASSGSRGRHTFRWKRQSRFKNPHGVCNISGVWAALAALPLANNLSFAEHDRPPSQSEGQL